MLPLLLILVNRCLCLSEGLELRRNFSRMVLNQKGMEIGEKLMKRARLDGKDALASLLPDDDIKIRYKR